MDTTAKQTKLTKKQIFWSLLLSLAYFFMKPFIAQTHPLRRQVEDLLNEADTISGDYSNVISRRADGLTADQALRVISFMDTLN
jgi:hypothetical protein